ncbi:acyl-CoA dehydrogenase family protein [Sphingomonas sp.]|uniref:acyl-CoA dehydrogenase family protein n=1 Tax=Sphingomonas sp. TaxID=28214 RepID=UPI003CC501CC
MDFTFSDEQTLLRDSVAGVLRSRQAETPCSAGTSAAGSRRIDIWHCLAHELGVLGAAVECERGGLGGGPIEHMIIMEELGAALVREPYLETVVIGAGLFARCGGETAANALGKVLEGEMLVAYASAEPGMGIDPRAVATSAVRQMEGWRLHGRKRIVTAAPWASHLVVLARVEDDDGTHASLALFLVDKSLPGVLTDDFATLDGRWAADISFDGVAVPDAARLTKGDAYPLVLEIADRAITAGCAEALGLMRRLLEDTKSYVKQRRQFGTTLSSFQVVRHRLADMLIHLEMATSAVYLATLTLGESADRRALSAASAKLVVDDASRFIGQNAIQLHGGMGMTEELAIGRFVKRLMAISADFGAADLYVEREVARQPIMRE